MNAGEKITLGTLTYKRGISEYSAQVWIASQGYIPDMHITFEQPIVIKYDLYAVGLFRPKPMRLM